MATWLQLVTSNTQVSTDTRQTSKHTTLCSSWQCQGKHSLVQRLQAPGLQRVHVQHTLRQQHASKAQHGKAAIPVLCKWNPGQPSECVGVTFLACHTPAWHSTARHSAARDADKPAAATL